MAEGLEKGGLLGGREGAPGLHFRGGGRRGGRRAHPQKFKRHREGAVTPRRQLLHCCKTNTSALELEWSGGFRGLGAAPGSPISPKFSVICYTC